MAITTLPPRVLTAEEYERYWKPQGWQLIIIGPTSTWRQDWGEWEAIREIVQNALDEAEAYQWGYDENGLWISDQGKGVSVADFLLGPPKLKPEWSRGKYGEGMKIGCLALIRKGYPIYIKTVGRELWVVFFQQKVDGMAETLAAIWRPDGTFRGTKFHIIGYRGDAFADRFAVNLPRDVILWESPSLIATPIQRYNQLIKLKKSTVTEPSRIYARDIYMRDINSPFSYNLWSFELAPDRYAPKNEEDLWRDIGRLWVCVSRVDLLEVFLHMVTEPPLLNADESRKIIMWAMGRIPVTDKPYEEVIKDNASYWQEAWRRAFGENAVILTDSRLYEMVRHLGYSPIMVSLGVRAMLTKVIKTDREIVVSSQKRLGEAQIVPDEQLSSTQLAHLKLARKISSYFESGGRAADVYAAIIPAASEYMRTAGMYSRVTQIIYISPDRLNYCRDTIDTIIHEIAHHVSDADDRSERHIEAMTKVAARVVELTVSGAFDKELSGVIW
jgi:hypothetical protein